MMKRTTVAVCCTTLCCFTLHQSPPVADAWVAPSPPARFTVPRSTPRAQPHPWHALPRPSSPAVSSRRCGPVPSVAAHNDEDPAAPWLDASVVGGSSEDHHSGAGEDGTAAPSSHSKRPNAVRGINIVLNGMMLTTLLLAIAASFVTIDSSISRGWQPDEIILRLLPDTWQAYERALVSNPIAVKAMITGATYFLGDWIAQAFQRSEENPADTLAWLDVDRTRLLRGLMIGIPLGVLAHFYYEFNDSWLHDFPVALKIFVDQTAYLSVYNSFYYVGLGVLAGKNAKQSVLDYMPKFWPLLTAGWKLWPAVGIVTYSVIPLEHRLLWVDLVEIAYSAILSTLSNEEEGHGSA